VRITQEISQKRLKGSPRTFGSMRSHSGAEKHMAVKGMSAKRSEMKGGLRRETSMLVL